MSDLHDRIPKVELHCHLEGTIRPATVAELAAKHGRELAVDRVEDLYTYDSLNGFLEIFWFVQELLVDPDDWERAAYESVVDAAPHGLRYREAFFTPTRHVAAGQDLGDIVGGLTRGLEAAEAETGVRSMLICDMDRAYGGDAGLALIERLVELGSRGRADRVIGVGMDSIELGVNPADYLPAYELARSAGLRRTAHAGEDTGADNISEVLDVLGVERVDHGLSVLDDAELTKRLAAERIPLDVCPNSNVLIANKVPSLAAASLPPDARGGAPRHAEHRRPRDDGPRSGQGVPDSVAEALDLSFDDVAAVALDGVEAAWLDDGDRRAIRAEFERDIKDLRPA